MDVYYVATNKVKDSDRNKRGYAIPKNMVKMSGLTVVVLSNLGLILEKIQLLL